VAGNTIHVRAGTYTAAATKTLSAGGSSGLPITWQGYTTTRGDNGLATIQITSTTITAFNVTGTLNRIRNFSVDCNNQNASRGVTMGGTQGELENVHVSGGCKTHGISLAAAGLKVRNLSVTGADALPVSITSGQTLAIGLWSYANSASGFTITNAALACFSCGSVLNTGATSDGVQANGTSTASNVWWVNSVAHGNGRDGIRATTASGADGLVVYNSILTGNTGYGVNSETTDWSGTSIMSNYNAFHGNLTAARNQFPAGANDFTLTGNPFTNAGGGDFTLNSTVGAGASLRGAGWPGALAYGGTGYRDVGPLQSQCSGGGGGGGCSVPFIH
jgi:hypothetical protein